MKYGNAWSINEALYNAPLNENRGNSRLREAVENDLKLHKIVTVSDK